MHLYSIQEILDLRSLYKDPPYPGFSLEEACRRKKKSQTKLVRGANAWVARGAVKTTEEWVERLVQGSLNKLTEANFDMMVKKLQTEMLFSSEEILEKAVSLIFDKALDEPENSKSYAGVCYKIALFEVDRNVSPLSSEKKKQSKFRNAIVGVAEKEFANRCKMPGVEGLSAEEIEQRRSTFMRRKKANMKFVGELFMHKVLSEQTMSNIIRTIMQVVEKGRHPPSEDIEFLTELLLTVGESLDALPETKVQIDNCFKQLGRLEKLKEVYPPRIRFKILDLLELRHVLKWKPRATKTPAVQQQQQQPPQQSKPSLRAPTLGTAVVASTSDAKKTKQTTTAFTAAEPNRSWRSVVKSEPAAPPETTCGPSAVRAGGSDATALFERRTLSMMQEWVADCTNERIFDWTKDFADCRQVYASNGAMCKAAAAVVAREACMTTKTDAQREAVGFLVLGLFLLDNEIFDGYAMALAGAIEDGVLEDVPKFSERFMLMLSITSGEHAAENVYYDAAKVLCTTYGLLKQADEMAADTLMEFWGKIPAPPAEEPIALPIPVLRSLAEMQREGQEPVAGRIIASLHTIGVIDGETVKEWLDSPLEGVSRKVAEEFQKAMHAARG